MGLKLGCEGYVDSLLEAVTALASARTLEEVTNIVRRSARAVINSDGVTFVLREADKCYYAEEDAIAPLWKGSRFDLGSCVSGWAMLNRQIAVIPDIYKDPRVPHDAYRPTFVKSMMMVPVRQDDPIGAIGAYWACNHEPTWEQQRILQALANAAALALRNIELNADLERSLQREREARSQAETASRLKDEFLSTLSHELRTPLHVVQNWVWELNRSEHAEAVKKGLEVIDRNVSLQSRLIEDLLDVSRASTGKLKLAGRPVDVGAICSAVLEIARAAAHAKNIRLEVRQQKTPPIWADPDRIQQILWNVLSNSIKFTPPDGHIGVHITHVDRQVRVLIEDSGSGVEADFLPYMFDRFRHGDPSMTRRYGGLGLGLTIVKELVQLHGGAVRASSAGAGHGTTVTMEFPSMEVPDTPEMAAALAAGGVID